LSKKKRETVTVLESEMGTVDLTESPAVPLPAPVEPEQPPMHPLDGVEVGSKIVVTSVGAILAGPWGHSQLPKDDPASKLPVGAKITKLADSAYLSTQLSPAEDHPEQVYRTASEAIQNFVRDFHS
jgi:hypothetical protein